MELVKHAKRVNLRSRPIRIWNNQKSVDQSWLISTTFEIKSYWRCWLTFFGLSIVEIWTLIFTLGNHQALGSGCNPNPDNKNKAIFRWAFSLQNRRDFVGFQANGSKRELGAKCKSFLLSLAWKNLKQKLISFQVKVDRYKSELPDLQKL